MPSKTAFQVTLTLILILALLSKVDCNFTYIDSTNINGTTNLSAILSSNQSTCTSAPVSRLNLCNNSCVTCLSTDASKCATCGVGYYLDGTSCILNQTNYNYTYLTYIGTTLNDANNTISNFRYTSSNASLTAYRITSICQTSNYEIEMAGVFG